MASAATFSYEHPRRIRPFPTSAEKRNDKTNDENLPPSSSTRRLEEALSRLEYTTNEKISALFSRLDKCSDLSVASSRAVAALSTRFEELQSETESKLSAINASLSELKSNMNRVCSESQNLTMTALEDCCSELVKQIKANTDSISRSNERYGKMESEFREFAERNSSEVAALSEELQGMSEQMKSASEITTALSDEMRIVAEESVNACLADINMKVMGDLESFDMDWKEYRDSVEQKLQTLERKLAGIDQAGDKRYDDLRHIFEERMRANTAAVTKEIETRVVEVHMPAMIVNARKELEATKEELKRMINALPVPSPAPQIPESVFKNISAHVEEVQSIMASFSASTVPTLYRDLEMRIAQCEHHTQQHSLDLLKEFATEFEFDVDRMVELIHSVFVQTNVPMPAGTITSWRRFKEVMFDKENFGGVRVRRPILDVSQYATPRDTSVHKSRTRSAR